MTTELVPIPRAPAWGMFVLQVLMTAVFIAGVGTGVCWGSILWNGRPEQYTFTACPTSFFISSLCLVVTGACLAIAGACRQKWKTLLALHAGLLSGAMLLGFQGYGIWLLLPGRFLVTNASFRIAIVLASMHWLCSLLVLMLINVTAARVAHAQSPDENRFLLKICSYYWLGLGFFWTGLLCGFGVLL